MRKGVIGIGALIVVMILANSLNSNDDAIEPTIKVEDGEDEEMDLPTAPDPKTYLTVGGNSNPAEYESNSSLYTAHLNSATITYNARFNAGGDELTDENVLASLQRIKESLSGIEYDGEKRPDIDKVLELTEDAIAKKVGTDHALLYEIHDIIHKLDVHFNVNALEDTKVDKKGYPIHVEDRMQNG
ncbi:hypothetical protein [Oceanobacillus halotolerans]|uniref:hypothetical protein n=1 Tax=Oceanobacillus halotolerans TaxID=2663380 RepID=UPI0013DD4DF7|nr:hypothetical protein [Oceanobacillus halotolerans]